jgi:hypothetical protein
MSPVAHPRGFMSQRFAIVLVLSVAVVVIAGCTGSAPPTSAVAPSSAAASPAAVSSAAAASPVPVRPVARVVPEPMASPVVGDVDGSPGRPELSIEPVTDQTLAVTIADPTAKAWRLVVSGTGEHGGDRWEIAVETGDVEPLITATEIRDGKVIDVMDLSGYADGTAATGGCHSTLPVCLESDGFRLPRDGDGRFSVRLELPDARTPLLIRGGTAGWPGEPFELGPWRDTAPFPWGETGRAATPQR